MDARSYVRATVYDGVLRTIHAVNGLLIVALTGLGWTQKLTEPGATHVVLSKLHMTLGMALVVGLVARLVWGFVGPQHARLVELWHPATWRRLWRNRYQPAPSTAGHDPRAAGAYVALYAVLLGMAASGIALAGLVHNRGPAASELYDTVALLPWMKLPHELGLYAVTLFIVVHLGALVRHERVHGYPVAQSMVSGFQYRPVKDGQPGETSDA